MSRRRCCCAPAPCSVVGCSGTMPTEWAVTFSGLSDGSSSACLTGSCAALNTTLLINAFGDCCAQHAYGCNYLYNEFLGVSVVFEVDPLNSHQWRVTVILGVPPFNYALVWSKTYATKPTCATFNDSLPFIGPGYMTVGCSYSGFVADAGYAGYVCNNTGTSVTVVHH